VGGFLGRVPAWAAIVGVAVLLVGAAGIGGYELLSAKPHVNVGSNAQDCTSRPSKLATLFSDGQTTMIRLSNPDYTNMSVLRTEPANVLPGMFQSLMAVSPDSSKLAYVTATDELLDNAHIEAIDVANPGAKIDLATVPKGLWTTAPAWSADGTKLAFVRIDASVKPAGFQLWVADMSTQPATVAEQTDLSSDNFTGGHASSLCWTSDNRVVVIPATPQGFPSPSPVTASARPQGTPSPVTGSACGVPIYSQNDPAWQAAVMKSGADTIGGAGCALTSTAMLLNYYGAQLSPVQLNACLGAGADPIDWKAVPACTNGAVTGGDRIDFTWQDLDALLASGRPAIVGMLRGQTGSHFVVVTSGGGGLASNYHITDPWDATTYKTLASYVDVGYTPTWIISYSGSGHNCARLITGVAPVVTGVVDGGTGHGPVVVHLPPNIKYLKVAQYLQLSDGTIDPTTTTAPFNPHPLTDGTTFSADGIYQLLIVTQAPSQPPVVQTETFTIDTVAPAVGLSLLNPKSFGDRAGGPGAAAIVSSKYPGVGKPGKVEVTSSDTLSGVKTIQTSLDGGPLTSYSNDTVFFPVLTVNKSGDHALTIQSTDAAGNVKTVTKYFTVFGATASPSPSPSPTPTSRPTPKPTPSPTCATKPAGRITASADPLIAGVYDVTWYATGGCPPYSGGTVAAYACGPNPLSPRLPPVCNAKPYHTYAINGTTATIQDNYQSVCTSTSGYFIRYTLTVRDSFGQTSFVSYGSATATPDGCVIF